MSAPSTSKRDAISAAMSVADDVAQNKLDPSSLDDALADELRRLFGDVVGEDDSLWPLQLDVARRVIALGGIGPDELSEWAAALRHRDPEPSKEHDRDDDSTAPVSTGSDALSPQNDALDAIVDAASSV
ncbi:flagellar hook-length control protein [Mycobacterium avium subsp. hominissuis]|uniref:flagellar hook-length control protein n=1 Tax=Mycobacterium avium TaxID=1764 RepID=UPI000BB0DDDB|nr:flagellar hook-length control protein [Mycobacterium avium]PBD11477.1 flagellar hook-length control protein [Mycobacterium avium subsp. hominissuis]